MIKLEHVVLASPEQMEFIIEGMRNPMNSWEKSDSKVCNYISKGYCDACEKQDNCATYREETDFYLGGMDEDLMQRLAKAGTDHRKFMRMMPVYVRITAPLYWWKEFDTYRTGVTPNPMDIEMNSCSTMHKIQEKEFTLDDFSTDKIIDTGEPEYENMYDDLVLALHFDCEKQYYDPHDIYSEILIPALNLYRKRYLETKNKLYWWQMIQLLPSSYKQTRNVMMNYEVLANIYKSRKNHKLDEWVEFCKWIEELPYSEIITCSCKNKDLVEVCRCKDCQYYISSESMKSDETYKDYQNILNADGLCISTDKWTDENDFCSCAKKRED